MTTKVSFLDPKDKRVDILSKQGLDTLFARYGPTLASKKAQFSPNIPLQVPP